jgi:16S rRNA (uracil1498-N3)-methyltransferase
MSNLKFEKIQLSYNILSFVWFGLGKINMHRFFVSVHNISAQRVIISDSRVHQIRDVLRMKTGDEIIVLDNTGFEYQARLLNISPKEVVGEIISKKICESEPRTQITLYQSLLAREKFEFVLQKCTEIGVTQFVPVITERSIVRKAEKITKQKLARFESIIAEAAEQSARGKIPILKKPVDLSQAVSELDDYDVCLVGSTQNCHSLKKVLQECKLCQNNLALFIGPEGGFSDRELDFMEIRAVKLFSLGKRILRTETAAVAATAIILYELG